MKLEIPLINTHTHAAMVAFRGMGEDLPLDRWLQDVIWPAEGKSVSADFVREQTLIAMDEMRANKIKAFADMYFFQEEVAKLAEKEKFHVLLGESVIDFALFPGMTVDGTLEKTEELLVQYKDSEYVNVAVTVHSIYTVCKENLLKSKELARKYNAIFHMHMAETKKEYDDSMKNFGMSPVAYADSLGLLDERTLLAHCVWLTAEDMDILAARGVSVSHCPLSNMKLGSGAAPIQKLLDRGVNVTLGTDGAASSNRLDIWEAGKMAALLAKVHSLDSTALDTKQVARMMSVNGMKALGIEKIDGQSIEDVERIIEETDFSDIYFRHINEFK